MNMASPQDDKNIEPRKLRRNDYVADAFEDVTPLGGAGCEKKRRTGDFAFRPAAFSLLVGGLVIWKRFPQRP